MAPSTRERKDYEKDLRIDAAGVSKGPMPVSQAEVARLYRDHAARVHRWVLRFGPRADAEELVHEVFLKVVEQIDRFRAQASATTWLYRMTTNHCLNRLRDRDRRAELLLQHADALWGCKVTEANQETAEFLRQFWRTLDDDLVEVGVYYFIDGMTHAEIARVVGCSERTIGNRLDRLRKAALAARTRS
jgi:RNA polymerase sigma-70 factor (ECF subfamily)